MTNSEHLAIASIPIQQWKEVYPEEQALFIGTIFSELNKPFYVTAQNSILNQTNACTDKDCMLLQIQQVSFVLDDLRLYLDTHPQDKQGIELMKTMLQKRKTLLKDFAQKHYPLTMDCMADIYTANPDSECYCWQEGPAPWEGVCV